MSQTIFHIEQIFKSFFDKSSRYGLPFIILIHLSITVVFSIHLNIWIDEAFSLNTTNSGLVTTLKRATYFELQPPFYFLILILWRNISQSIFFARLLSILFTCGTIYVSAKLSERLFKQLNPAWVASLVAFNPFVIWAATEIRCYALVLLFSGLLILFFYDGYASEGVQGRGKWCYILFAIAALYTHYYLGFLLAANGLTLLILRRLNLLRAYLIGMFIVFFIFSPMLLVLHHQVTTHLDFIESVSFYRYVQIIHWRIKEYLLPSGELWGLVKVSKWIFNLGIIVGLFYIIKKRAYFFRPHNVALITIGVITCIFFLVFINHPELMQQRHFSVLFLPSIFLLFSTVQLVHRRGVLMSCCLILFIFYGSALFEMYKRCAKPGDWQRVASHIMKIEKAGESILIFRNGQALPFSYYYKGLNNNIPIPNQFNCDTYDLSSSILKDEKMIFQALKNIPGGSPRLWIITSATKPHLDVDINPIVLEGFIKKWCIVEKEQSFYGSLVRYVALKENWRESK
jgi:uncharacterized membrane protein